MGRACHSKIDADLFRRLLLEERTKAEEKVPLQYRLARTVDQIERRSPRISELELFEGRLPCYPTVGGLRFVSPSRFGGVYDNGERWETIKDLCLSRLSFSKGRVAFEVRHTADLPTSDQCQVGDPIKIPYVSSGDPKRTHSRRENKLRRIGALTILYS